MLRTLIGDCIVARKKDPQQRSFETFAQAKPELSVLSDHPLNTDSSYLDSFDLRYKVGPIYDIIRHPKTNMPMTIAIYGDWGTGKTSAMRWLAGLLDVWNQSSECKKGGGQKVWPVWFYPWKYDNKEDVWRGLISEVIIESIKVENATWQRAKTAAKQFGLFLGKGFLHALASVKFKAKLAEGAEAEADLSCLKEILSEYEQTAHPEKAFLNEFEDSLKQWVGSTLSDNERMVIFIDDLDRCLPEIALQVLEALKLYLNIPKLIFVVGVDKDVVDRLIVEHYRKLGLVAGQDTKAPDPERDGKRQQDERKARSYLAKMFQVEVTLQPSEDQVDQLLERQLEGIDYWEKLSEAEEEIFHNLILKEARSNPREIKRLLNSAMMSGVGVLMLAQEGEPDNGPMTFAQGLQLYFIHRILTEKHRMRTMATSRRGIAFFDAWSKVVCQGRKQNAEFSVNINIPLSFTKHDRIAEVEHETIPNEIEAVSVVEAVDIARGKSRNLALNRLHEIDLSFAPESYHAILSDTQFKSLWHLLEDEDLGQLMQVPYPASTAQQMAVTLDSGRDAEIVREAIARQLDKDLNELAELECQEIRELNLSDSEFKTLSVLEKFNNLHSLYLRGTQVSDFSSLAALTKLRSLGLDSTQIVDTSVLSCLAYLQYLDLSNTSVSDVLFLKELRLLQFLDLSNTQVLDITSIAKLECLVGLDLNDTKVSDISSLSNLTNLQSLNLDNTEVSDISSLSNLMNLRSLILDNTEVSDISSLSNLTNLQNLYLRGTQVSDISSLSNLMDLQYLTLRSTQVSDVSSLSNLTKLQYLTLSGTQVSDLSSLLSLTNLERCDFSGTKISDKQIESFTKAFPDVVILH